MEILLLNTEITAITELFNLEKTFMINIVFPS